MPPDIVARESNLLIMYRFRLQSGAAFTIAVSIVSPEQGRDVIRGASDAYALIIPISPTGHAYPFLRGARQPQSYVEEKLSIDSYTAGIYAAIMPQLTSMAPADDILAAAVAYLERDRL